MDGALNRASSILQELPESERGGQAIAFVCPMCEHHRGGVSNFACPPSPGNSRRLRSHAPSPIGLLERVLFLGQSISLRNSVRAVCLSYLDALFNISGLDMTCVHCLMTQLPRLPRGATASRCVVGSNGYK